MNKEYYHANEIREELTWSGGGVSLNGSHVTLPKVTETIVTETSRQRALSENQSHVTHI